MHNFYVWRMMHTKDVEKHKKLNEHFTTKDKRGDVYNMPVQHTNGNPPATATNLRK